MQKPHVQIILIECKARACMIDDSKISVSDSVERYHAPGFALVYEGQ